MHINHIFMHILKLHIFAYLVLHIYAFLVLHFYGYFVHIYAYGIFAYVHILI